MIDIICCFNDIPPKQDWDGQKEKLKKINGVHLSYVDQFVCLYHSIKKNWSFDYEIYLCHSKPLSAESQRKLQYLDIKIIQVESPDPKNYPYLIRSSAWKIKTQGTHKLYLDTDMIALKNPTFDLSKDFLVMPCNSNVYNAEGRIIKLIKCCSSILTPNTSQWNLRENILNDLWTGSLSCEEYVKGNFLPHFNGGSILMKNELSSIFSNNWWRNFTSMINLWNKGKQAQTPLLFADGLTILKMSQNWSLFEIGFNYFDQYNCRFSVNPNFFDKNKISLYHYVESHNLYERFGDYFHHIN